MRCRYHQLSASRKDSWFVQQRIDLEDEERSVCFLLLMYPPVLSGNNIKAIHLGSWLVNTARGAIVVKEDVADALKSGHLRGYGGDVWFPQPAPKDHPLRYAKNPFDGGKAMVPHKSGTSLDAQKRYADGVKNILESYLSGKHDYRPEDLIVHNGDYATKAYGQRAKK